MEFPRTVLPVEVSDLDLPGPLISKAQSGRVNTRATMQVGRTWKETFLIRMRDVASKAFLATVRTLWRNGTVFDVMHMDYQTPNGVGGGSPLVNGANQTGSGLAVDGAPLNTPAWLRAGDLLKVGGLSYVFDVTADVSTNGAGQATIYVNPPIFSGGSPADNAVVTITNVKIRAVILEPPQFPTTRADDFGELSVTFSEAL